MSTVTEIEARKARAVALLTEWLRDDDPIFGLLDEIREAVRHLTDCNGIQCMDWQHKHGDAANVSPDSDCAGPCGGCDAYKNGNGVNIWRTRPTLELIDELSARLERREEERAS